MKHKRRDNNDEWFRRCMYGVPEDQQLCIRQRGVNLFSSRSALAKPFSSLNRRRRKRNMET